jgi:hypothetical protein
MDDPGILKSGCDFRDGCSSHAKHVGKKLVSKWNGIARDLVACLQEPTTEACGNLMQGVAGGCLLYLA